MEKMPDLSSSFPEIAPDVKVSSDLDNAKHGPHYDVVQGIPGGTDQIRTNLDGDIVGGTTNIGKIKMDW